MKRGDIIVFRYPIDIKQTYVKRAMGVPGDHIHLVNKQLYLNGHPLDETKYAVHKTEYIDSYRDNFPSDPNVPLTPPAQAMLDFLSAKGARFLPRTHGRVRLTRSSARVRR